MVDGLCLGHTPSCPQAILQEILYMAAYEQLVRQLPEVKRKRKKTIDV